MNMIDLFFYFFSAILIVSAVLVVVARNAVHAALFLVLAFFSTAALWILLQAEFLALILILVYVGAVMTLFLFVIMMLNLDLAPKRAGFVKYLPLGLLICAMLVVAIVYAAMPSHYLEPVGLMLQKPVDFSSAAQLGAVLYTDYVYPFEISGLLLLVAIISAITLNLRHPRSKKQNISRQLHADPKTRVTLVSMKSEKPTL